MSEDFGLRLATPAFYADPYPTFDFLRQEAPVYWSSAMGRWFLTRYADIDTILRDSRWSADRITASTRLRPVELQEELQPLFRILNKQMLFADPPDHTRLRGLVSKAFTPRVVERLRERIAAIVDELLDRYVAEQRMDAIRDLAYPLPVIVISELLGVPLEDRQRFKEWSTALAGFLGNFRRDPAVDRHAMTKMVEAAEYFRTTAVQLRDQPRDELLSLMVSAEDRGDRLSIEELLANSILILSAGHETTTNLIGNGLYALLCNPDQHVRLRTEPDLISNAVEEILRYESPVQSTSRIAPHDADLDGQVIQAGELVHFWLAAGNRDPARFPDPARFDVGRADTHHLGFGAGIHFCLGAPLARLEGQVALARLLERLPDLRLASETVTWQVNPSFRGLTALPVAW